MTSEPAMSERVSAKQHATTWGRPSVVTVAKRPTRAATTRARIVAASTGADGSGRSYAFNMLDAHEGDRLIVESNRVGGPRRTGTVIEVLGPAASRHYRVLWDDGQDNLFFPSSDAAIEHAAAQA